MSRTRMVLCALVGVVAMAGCGTEAGASVPAESVADDPSIGASATPNASTVAATPPPAGDVPVDEELCALLAEQAELAMELGADPDFGFGVRDMVSGALLGGEIPINAMDFLPAEIRDAQDELEDGIDDLLPLLDEAVVTNGDPTADLEAFHAAYDATAQQILDYANDGCPR